MSKDLLLSFAKGGEMKLAYIVTYEVDPDSKEIRMLSYSNRISGILPDDSIMLQICRTREDVEIDVSEEEIKRAVAEYLKVK